MSLFDSLSEYFTDITVTFVAVIGDWPSLDDIEKKLDLSDDDLANVSVSGLLIPSYANFTNNS